MHDTGSGGPCETGDTVVPPGNAAPEMSGTDDMMAASVSRTFANTLRNRRARQKSALPPLRWLPRLEEHAPGQSTLIGAQVDMSQLWLSVPRRTMRRVRRKSLSQRQREFDQDLIRTACLQAMTWPSDARLLVCLEDDQAPDADFNSRLAITLHETGFPFARLDLVFHEAGLAQDCHETSYTLASLRDQGCQIFMGGLGTPPSSLTLLRERGVNGLLDGVQFDLSVLTMSSISWDGHGALEFDAGIAAFYRSILDAVVSIGLKVRATGIDTPELLDFAREVGCSEMSGALIAPAETGTQISERFDILSGRPRRRRMGRTTEGL